jgi:hypothetical protein
VNRNKEFAIKITIWQQNMGNMGLKWGREWNISNETSQTSVKNYTKRQDFREKLKMESTAENIEKHHEVRIGKQD